MDDINNMDENIDDMDDMNGEINVDDSLENSTSPKNGL